MKVRVLEFNRYKCGIIKVHEYRKHKGKYILNPKFSFHEYMLDKPTIMFPVIYKKYYKIEK
jgi:hypothetical protein